MLLPLGISVFTLDLSGSGRSEGDYISLGYFEQDDLRVAVEYLKTQAIVSKIGLWGRSMGAVTCILHAAENKNIDACVLDSPFKDVKSVAEAGLGSGSKGSLQAPRVLGFQLP